MNNLVFHIGFHKTGTTWLQNIYFQNKNHFNIINDFVKPWDDELCKQIINSSDFDLNQCKKIIGSRVKPNNINILSAERLSGHPISGGYDVMKIAKRLKDISSQAKIIVSRREPSSFITSAYKQMVKEGYCGNLHDFLFSQSWKVAGVSRDYFDQDKIINIYKEMFTPENVLILSFEEFKTNKTEYIKTIEAFLGIKHVTLNDKKLNVKLNETFSDKRIKALRVLNRLRRTELNPFPIINLGDITTYRMSFLLSAFFSNKYLIKKEILNNYLRNK